jgi:thymidine phosphorylase
LDRLVLDVKVGSGGFMATAADARALARALVDVASSAGVRTRALLTEMGRPLGRAVGNAVEVTEAVACLQGRGPADLRELVLALARHPDAAAVLDSGRAFARFERVVAAQGGDVGALHHPRRLAGAGCAEAVLRAGRSGVVQRVHARAVAEAAFALGAGRRHADDDVDPGVGVLLDVAPGDAVQAGDAVARLLHRDGRGLVEALGRLDGGIVVGDGPVEVPPLVHEVIDGPQIG